MTADLTAAELERMRRVAEGATPGPWNLTPDEGGVADLVADGMFIATLDDRDAPHIATFDPPTVLALLDRLEAAEARVARVEALAGDYDAYENWRIWLVPQAIRAALRGDA